MAKAKGKGNGMDSGSMGKGKGQLDKVRDETIRTTRSGKIIKPPKR